MPQIPKKRPTLEEIRKSLLPDIEIIYQVLQQAGVPLGISDITERFLELRPLEVKNPPLALRNRIKNHSPSKGRIISINKKYALENWYYNRVPARVRLSASEIENGIISIDWVLSLFFPNNEVKARFINQPDGLPIKGAILEIFGSPRISKLSRWYMDNCAQPGDEVIITPIDIDNCEYLVRYEPSQKRNHKKIARANKVFTDTVYEVLSEQGKPLPLYDLIPLVHSRIDWNKIEAPENYIEILSGDSRFEMARYFQPSLTEWHYH